VPAPLGVKGADDEHAQPPRRDRCEIKTAAHLTPSGIWQTIGPLPDDEDLTSLALGIVLGALLYAQGNVLAAGAFVLEVASGLIIDEGAVAEEVYILAVVLLLGVLTSLIYVSGGLVAFAAWATTLARTRVQAQLVPVVVGIVIFFDWIIIGGPADVPCRLHPRRRAVRVCRGDRVRRTEPRRRAVLTPAGAPLQPRADVRHPWTRERGRRRERDDAPCTPRSLRRVRLPSTGGVR
jgi:hypothetical protein